MHFVLGGHKGICEQRRFLQPPGAVHHSPKGFICVDGLKSPRCGLKNHRQAPVNVDLERASWRRQATHGDNLERPETGEQVVKLCLLSIPKDTPGITGNVRLWDQARMPWKWLGLLRILICPGVSVRVRA